VALAAVPEQEPVWVQAQGGLQEQVAVRGLASDAEPPQAAARAAVPELNAA
jgi:hypothetical protein